MLKIINFGLSFILEHNYLNAQMSVIIILVIIGIIVAGGFLVAFIWAVKSGQYDDIQSPAVRILYDNTEFSENTSEEDKIDNN